MSKMQRTKGATYERETFALLQDWFGDCVTRNYGQSALGGHDMDVGEAFRVECKRRAGIAVYPWLDQAIAAAEGTQRMPVVIARADRREPIVIMRACDALKLMRGEL